MSEKKIILCPNPNRDQGMQATRAADAILREMGFRTVVCSPFKDQKAGAFADYPVRPLPQELRDMCARTDDISTRYDGMQVNVCLNYGGRDEIVRAARAFAADCAAGKKAPEELTEEDFSHYLYSDGVPDPDLVIRPSGEIRISNFLLWQSAYAEFYYTDALWPDFSKEELHKALAAYQGRSRRFGGV